MVAPVSTVMITRTSNCGEAAMGPVLACVIYTAGVLFLLAFLLLVCRYLPSGDDQVARWLRRGCIAGLRFCLVFVLLAWTGVAAGMK